MSSVGAVFRLSALRAFLGVVLLVPAALAQIGFGKLFGAQSLPGLLSGQVSSILLAFAGYVVLRRFIERDSPTELFGHVPQLFLGGAVVGALLMCLTMAVIALAATAALAPGAGLRPFLVGIPVFLNVAVFEELLFRGIVFRLTERSLGSLAATVVSALVFGGAHLLNPHSTFLSALAIAMEAGVLLAASYLVFRSLWFAIGLHFAWDWFEGSVFGATDSGVTSSGLVQTTLAGPDWLTGGAFGPEGSVPAVIICTAVGALGLLVAWRRGQWRSLAYARGLLARERSPAP